MRNRVVGAVRRWYNTVGESLGENVNDIINANRKQLRRLERST